MATVADLLRAVASCFRLYPTSSILADAVGADRLRVKAVLRLLEARGVLQAPPDGEDLLVDCETGADGERLVELARARGIDVNEPL